MTEPLLRAEDLCRVYRRGPQEIRAVDGVSLAIGAGEFVAIVGASGSGKSTLLNLLAGLDTPTGGTVAFEGRPLGALGRRELAAYRARQVGMVFQSFQLLSHRTAQENVALALCFAGEPPGARATRGARAGAMLTRLGLGERLTHRPADLSGGEQQRVAIARALVKQPRVLFADEPTGDLDEENAGQIAALLSELNREGLTVVVATHNLALAREHAHRMVRMHYGRLAEGSPPAGEAAT